MKKVLIALGVLALVIIGVAVIAPALIPLDRIKSEAVLAVKEATGRDLTFKNLSVSVFPSIAVTADDVSLSNPAGFASTPMIHLAQLDASLKVMPLLSGRLEVDRFILDRPTIALESNANGQNNWTFDSGKPAAASDSSAAPQSGTDVKKSGGSDLLSDLFLEDIQIKDGTFTFADAKTGEKQEIQKISLDVGMKGLDKPLSVDGSITWQGRAIRLEAKVEQPRAVLGNGTTKLDTELSVEKLVKLKFDGQVNVGTLSANGKLDLSAPAVRDILAWLEGAAPALPPNTFGPLALKGTLAGSPDKVSFTNMEVSFDQLKGNGDLAVTLNKAVPEISAQLSTNVLNLDPYLASSSASTSTGGAGTAPAAPAAAKTSGWSTDPIDLSALKTVDATLALKVDGLVVEKITVGKSALQVDLHKGILSANLSEMAFYQGQGRAKIVLNASQPKLGIDLDASLQGMAIEPFLKDVASFSNLSGTGAVEAKITGSGSSEKQIVQSLNGNASIVFTNGTIHGIDLASMIQNVASAFGVTNTQGQKTEFTKMGGTFVITNGIATNKDFSLESPVIQASAAGTINLPDQTLNYRITPKVVSAIGSLSIPVVVNGPWSKLSWTPDLASIAAQQGQKLLQGVVQGGESGTNALQGLEKGIGKGLGGLFGR